LIIKFSPSAV